MPLPPRRPLSVFVSICLLGLLVGAGCNSQKTLQPWQHENVDAIALRPEWQRYADENYRGVVMAQFSAPTGIRFVDEPKVVASRNRTRGETELLAAGNVDVPEASGTRYRRPYSIVWRQSGGGWELADVHVNDEGQAVRPEPTSPQPPRPVSRPATAPAETPPAQ
jgi:hypothetical protein